MLYERNPIDDRRQRLREIFLELTSHGPSGFSVDLALFVARLPELCVLWGGDGVHRRVTAFDERLVRVDELERTHALWTDPDAFSKRLDELDNGLKLKSTGWLASETQRSTVDRLPTSPSCKPPGSRTGAGASCWQTYSNDCWPAMRRAASGQCSRSSTTSVGQSWQPPVVL